MFASSSVEIAVTKTQLLCALDRYEADIATLVARRWDPELYAGVSQLFDEMQLYAGVLPGLEVTWVEVLITRYDLLACLSKVRGPSTPVQRLDRLHREHGAALAGLRRRCAASAA